MDMRGCGAVRDAGGRGGHGGQCVQPTGLGHQRDGAAGGRRRGPEPTPLPVFDALVKSLTIRGYSLMEVTTDPVRRERGARFITEGLADGRLKPIIAKTFEQIVRVHRYMESNQQFGKIVVTVR